MIICPKTDYLSKGNFTENFPTHTPCIQSKMSCGGGQVCYTKTNYPQGGVCLGIFFYRVFVSLFARNRACLLQPLLYRAQVPQFVSASGESRLLCLGRAAFCVPDDVIHRCGVADWSENIRLCRAKAKDVSHCGRGLSFGVAFCL